jgi:hypothetical protein
MGQKAQVPGVACRYGGMDAHAPKCPTCGTAIQPHWDWCHLCGYDPDNLKPAGWLSPSEAAAEPAKGGRRQKRSGKKTAKKAAKQPVAAGSVSMAMAMPMTPAPMTPAPMTSAPMAPAMDDNSTVDIDAMLDPFVSHDHDLAPARPRSSIPPLVIASTPARPTIDTASEQVFHVSPAPIEVGLAAILVLIGLGVGYLAVTSIIQVAEGASITILDNVATVVFILLCAVVAFAVVAQARALMGQKVVLTPGDMTVHNRFGRVRKVPRNEIHQLRMSERQYPTPKGITTALDVPYVQLTDGSGIWLDALGSRNPSSSPTDEQKALYERLSAALASTGTRL